MMRRCSSLFSRLRPVAVVLAVLIGVAIAASQPAAAQDEDLDQAFRNLADPDFAGWERAESDIRRVWSRSGSASMDLLLQRGQDALDSGDTDAAIEHLTALTDHAPDFATGWAELATAYIAEGRFGPAVSDIGRALALEPRHWDALASLGSILEEIGDQPRALAAFRASFALNPHQQDVKDSIARLERAGAGKAL